MLDGELYKEFLTKEGGVFDAIVEYHKDRFGEGVELRFQQDGAPAHGFDNLHGRRSTQPQLDIVADGKSKGIHVFKQPRNSPELNVLDLSIWWSLQAKAREKLATLDVDGAGYNEGFLQSKIWGAVKEAWEGLEPRTIWNSFMVRDELLKMVWDRNGGSIVKEPHAGVRRRWGTWEE